MSNVKRDEFGLYPDWFYKAEHNVFLLTRIATNPYLQQENKVASAFIDFFNSITLMDCRDIQKSESLHPSLLPLVQEAIKQKVGKSEHKETKDYDILHSSAFFNKKKRRKNVKKK